MRADRLLSLLMLLQDRGRLTAQELAAQLEVSERTIYRDMVALSAAGVPVYTERGPGGGCALIESYRTNLTGLTRDEVRALFMLSIPSPLAELGVDQDLKAALLKLSAALPEVYRPDGVRARQRIHLDSSAWFQEQQPSPHIHIIQRALWEDRKLKLTYRLLFDAQVEHIVAPYGLIAKVNTWYLVSSRDGEIFIHKLVDVLDAQLTDETFSLPPEFDLVEFWSACCARYENNRPAYPVKAHISADMLTMLAEFNDPVIQVGLGDLIPDQDGWFTLTLHFEDFWEARKRILAFGGAVEVLEPEALRISVQDFARQTLKVYNP